MTNGMKSSEFYLSVVGTLALTVLAWNGTIDGETAATGIAALCGAYGISRGLAKKE